MDAAQASIEAQLIMAVGAIFMLMVILAAIDYWSGTSGDDRRPPPR